MKKMIFVIVSLVAIVEITITAVCMPEDRFKEKIIWMSK